MNTDLPTFTPPPPSNFAGLWWYCSCKCAVGRVPFGSFCTVWHGDMLLFHAVSKFFLWHWWHHVLAAGMQWVPSPSLPWTLRRAQMLEQGEFFPRGLQYFAVNNLLEQQKALKTFQAVFSCLSIGKTSEQYHDEIRSEVGFPSNRLPPSVLARTSTLLYWFDLAIGFWYSCSPVSADFFPADTDKP